MKLVKNEEGGSYTYFSGSDIVQGVIKGSTLLIAMFASFLIKERIPFTFLREM